MSKHKHANPKNPKKVFDPNAVKHAEYETRTEKFNEGHRNYGNVSKDKRGNY